MSTNTAAITTTVRLNEHNCKTWALETGDVLMQLGLSHCLPPGIFSRRPTSPPTSRSTNDSWSLGMPTKRKRREPVAPFFCSLEADIRCQFSSSDPTYRDPKVLWEAIKAKFEKAIQLDGKYEMQKLPTCKLADYASVSECVTAQDKIIANLSNCDIKVTDEWHVLNLVSNLPQTPEWLNFVTSLEVTDKAKSPKDVVAALEFFEAKLRHQRSFRDLTRQPRPSLLKVASLGGARVYSGTGSGCKLIVAFSSLERDFSQILRLRKRWLLL